MRDLLHLANDQVSKPKTTDELTPFELRDLENTREGRDEEIENEYWD